MWKIAVGFAVFAAVALFVIVKGGDSLDMSGEKHGGDAVHAPAAAPAAARPGADANHRLGDFFVAVGAPAVILGQMFDEQDLAENSGV